MLNSQHSESEKKSTKLAISGGMVSQSAIPSVSDMLNPPSRLPAAIARPEIKDPVSEESFQKYKQYNVDMNLRVNERRMWVGLVERILGLVMSSAALGLGITALSGTGMAPIAAIALVGAMAASVGLFFVFHQTSVREQTEKGMDVGDYTIRREAALIAKEIKNAVSSDIAPSAPVAPAASNAPENKVLATSVSPEKSTILPNEPKVTLVS